MRPLVFALAVTLGAPGLLARSVERLGTSDQHAEIRAARPLHVVYPHATLEGMCTLVHIERQAAHLELYFITSARFFKTGQGEPLPPATEVRVTMDDGTDVNVLREHRYLPIGDPVDIAVLRADVADGDFSAATMGFTIPAPGHNLEVVAYNRGGTPQIETQHVRFASTRFVVGDRDLSNLTCLGAPAIDGDEIVGLVSECEQGRAPLLTPLSVAFPFLARQIPGLAGRPTLREQP